jgi:hypothetical protein
MAEDAAYSAARATVKACVLASAAAAPPLWLFSRLTPYHFLFSAPTTLSWFGTIMNVCSFTGYLFAAAAIPTCVLYLYTIGSASWVPDVPDVLATFLIVSMAVIHFYHGAMGYGSPNTISRAIGALLLLPVAIRWIVPVRRFFHAHPLLFVPVAYAIGIGLAVLMAFAYASPEDLSLKSDDYSFYTAKSVLKFRFWDWLTAGAGALFYLAATIMWRDLLKPSTPGPEAA